MIYRVRTEGRLRETDPQRQANLLPLQSESEMGRGNYKLKSMQANRKLIQVDLWKTQNPFNDLVSILSSEYLDKTRETGNPVFFSLLSIKRCKQDNVPTIQRCLFGTT